MIPSSYGCNRWLSAYAITLHYGFQLIYVLSAHGGYSRVSHLRYLHLGLLMGDAGGGMEDTAGYAEEEVG